MAYKQNFYLDIIYAKEYLYFIFYTGLDYQFAGKQDAHRFGVELKENKQFHHTITGCVLFNFYFIFIREVWEKMREFQAGR